jgi:dolichol-phosphate mannosyltransferase
MFVESRVKLTGAILWTRLYPLIKRYTKFCIVGGTGVVVDMGIIWLLADGSMLNWNLTVSKVIAAEIAIVNNFLWNDIWTFRGLESEPTHGLPRLTRFAKFNLICVGGIALSVLLLNIQVYWLHMTVYLANFISIILVSVWNFVMNVKFGWTSPAQGEPQAAGSASKARLR